MTNPNAPRVDPITLPENPDDFWLVDFRALAGDLLTRPIVLSPDYLEAIDRVANHSSNKHGADKSWVWESEQSFRRHFANAVLVR
jgi:hypothetical protein